MVLWSMIKPTTEAAVHRCSSKKMFLSLKACNFIKKRLQHRCFPVNIAKLLRTPFSQNTSGGCFYNYLNIDYCYLLGHEVGT